MAEHSHRGNLWQTNVTNTNDPAANGLDVGEIAIGAVAGKLYTKKQDGTVITFTDSTTAVQANTDEAVALAIALG